MKLQVAEKGDVLDKVGGSAELAEILAAVDDKLFERSPPLWVAAPYNGELFRDGVYHPVIEKRFADSRIPDAQWALDPVLVVSGKVSILSGNRLATIIEPYHWFSAFEFLEWYYEQLGGSGTSRKSVDTSGGIWTAVAGNRTVALYGSFKDRARVRQFMRSMRLSDQLTDQQSLFSRGFLPACIAQAAGSSLWRSLCLVIPRGWFKHSSTKPLLQHIQRQASMATNSLTRRLYGDSAAAEFREAAHHSNLAPAATRHLERLYWVVKQYSPGWQVWDGKEDDGPFAEFQEAFGEHYGWSSIPLVMVQNVIRTDAKFPVIFPFMLRDLNEISSHEELSPHLLGRLLEHLDDAIRESDETDLIQTLQDSWRLCAYTTRTNFFPRSVDLIPIEDFDSLIEQQATLQAVLAHYEGKPSKQSNFRKGGLILSPET